MAAKVDKSKCAGCKSCIVACPVNAISMKDDVAEVNEADCVGCGACAGECPCEAITVE
jgi:Fe-S-cluster-containing hydrogenase component 2